MQLRSVLVIAALLVSVLDFASKVNEKSRQKKELEMAVEIEQELSTF